MITPNQIRERRLSTVETGGYDRDEVNELLVEVIESYEAVYNENKELFRKMEILANKIEEYRADEDSIKTAIISAQKMADGVVREANEKAEKTVSESASTAQQTVLDAKSKAEKIIGDARDYVANLTSEKEEAAAKIIAEAEERANAAIQGAKLVAQNSIDEAKALAKDMIEKAKAEKASHQDLDAKLKQEAENFRASLVKLYETQLGKLRGITEVEGASADEVEVQLNELMDDINALSIDNLPEVEEAVEETNETADEQEADETAEEAAEEVEEIEETEEIEEAVEDGDIISLEEDDEPEETAEEIISELFSDERLDDDEEDDDAQIDISSAVDAFSSDEITPFEKGSSIPVIEEEEGQLPFEAFFNVDKTDPHNTDETISLVPPEDEEDDDTSKFRGFFKKKK